MDQIQRENEEQQMPTIPEPTTGDPIEETPQAPQQPITTGRALMRAAGDQHTATAKLPQPSATAETTTKRRGPKTAAEKEKEAAEKAAADAPVYALISKTDAEAQGFTGRYVPANGLRAADAEATLSEGEMILYRLVPVVTSVNIDGREI